MSQAHIGVASLRVTFVYQGAVFLRVWAVADPRDGGIFGAPDIVHVRECFEEIRPGERRLTHDLRPLNGRFRRQRKPVPF